jgi:hypothetical protein
MPEVHKYIGYAVVSALGLLWLWPLVTWLVGKAMRRRMEPGRGFWPFLAVIQVTLAIQVVAGLILLGTHGVSAEPVLHYLYGSLFPIIVLVVAHVVARKLERDQWVPFAYAGFFCFGLTLRALFTGLGIG